MTNSGRTAIARKKPSRPLKDFMDIRRQLAGTDYLFKFYDHGCGKGSDVAWLRDQGFLVYGYDPEWFPVTSPDPRTFTRKDVVLCTYVLNVIPEKKERVMCIKQAWNAVRKGGVFVLSTRTKKEIENLAEKNGWKKHKDGYLTKTGTFQKGFSLTQLTNFAIKNLDKIDTIIPREDKQSSYSGVYIIKRKR